MTTRRRGCVCGQTRVEGKGRETFEDRVGSLDPPSNGTCRTTVDPFDDWSRHNEAVFIGRRSGLKKSTCWSLLLDVKVGSPPSLPPRSRPTTIGEKSSGAGSTKSDELSIDTETLRPILSWVSCVCKLSYVLDEREVRLKGFRFSFFIRLRKTDNL